MRWLPEQGQIAQLVQQQQQAEAAAAAKAAQQRQAAAQAAAATAKAAPASAHASATLAGLSQAAPPPSSPGGAGAVQAAESQIGVPYVWGAESPKGSGQPRIRLLGADRLGLGPGRRRAPALLGGPDGRLDSGADQRPPAG